MLNLREGKILEIGQIVQVYRNLNRQGFYSIRDKKTGIVLAYAPLVAIGGNIKFHVSERSRQRVLKEQKRNVHAWIEGQFNGIKADLRDYRKSYYNPYTNNAFTDLDTGDALSAATSVVCKDKYAFYISI